MLPADKNEMTERLSSFSRTKRQHNAEVILKPCELFAYGDIHYITNSFCKTL